MSAVALEQSAVDDILEGSAEQYVTFNVTEQCFGIEMARVKEIIRVPETVKVPLTPDSLVGLANLRGVVLPILDLRSLLQLSAIKYDDATRVIVVDVGRIVGLVVDCVSQVLNVDIEDVEDASGVQSTIGSGNLVGVIKDKQTGLLTELLDIESVVNSEFTASLGDSSANDATNEVQIEVKDENEDDIDKNTDQLVSFVVDHQEYAFNLQEVEEIVRLPDTLTKIPGTDSHVLGVINLRGRLLPLVSIRRMFCLCENELNEHNRILVVSLSSESKQNNSVGIVVDDVREVLRITEEEQESIPNLLGHEGESEISAICQLENGSRLVSILNICALFEHPAIKEAIKSSAEEADVSEIEQKEVDMEDDDTQLVVFQLAEQEYGISIDDVQEITRVPKDMNKVPKTADFIEGMVNLRGTVLPVLDMRARFGLERMVINDRQRVLVLNINGGRTGFVMDSVSEVLRLSKGQIEDAPNMSDDQQRIMGHVVNVDNGNRMIQVLDVHELLSEKEKSFLVE